MDDTFAPVCTRMPSYVPPVPTMVISPSTVVTLVLAPSRWTVPWLPVVVPLMVIEPSPVVDTLAPESTWMPWLVSPVPVTVISPPAVVMLVPELLSQTPTPSLSPSRVIEPLAAEIVEPSRAMMPLDFPVPVTVISPVPVEAMEEAVFTQTPACVPAPVALSPVRAIWPSSAEIIALFSR